MLLENYFWCAVCCCDRRSPLTLATTMFCRDRDRDRPTATDRPCQTFPFEENAGFAFRSRTQTISRESNVVFCIVFQIRHHQLRTQTFFLICLQIRHHHFRTQTFFLLGEVGSKCPKKGGEFLGCLLPKLIMLVRDYENAKESLSPVGFEPPRVCDRQRVRLTS